MHSCTLGFFQRNELVLTALCAHNFQRARCKVCKGQGDFEAALRHVYSTLFLRLFLGICNQCTVTDLIMIFWLPLDKAIFVFKFLADLLTTMKLFIEWDLT